MAGLKFGDNIWRNNKNKRMYFFIDVAEDCTNSRDCEKVVIYTDGKKTKVREEKEFYEKFSKIVGVPGD